METWFVGPTIGAVFGIAGLLRGRVANQRLVRIETAITQRAIEKPGNGDLAESLSLTSPVAVKDLGRALAELPERERLLVTLYYYEGMTTSQIAEILGISDARVMELLNASHQFLRHRLERNAGP